MKIRSYVFCSLFIASLCLILSVMASAQPGRHHGNKGKSEKYQHDRGWHLGHTKHYPKPYKFVHFGPAYGYRIKTLPVGYITIQVGGNPFYFYDGIYYRPYRGGVYEVVTAPIGAVVYQLPARAKTVTVSGGSYFELGGTFYQKRIGPNNVSSYIVIGINGVLGI